jgi:hypothetical protein
MTTEPRAIQNWRHSENLPASQLLRRQGPSPARAGIQIELGEPMPAMGIDGDRQVLADYGSWQVPHHDDLLTSGLDLQRLSLAATKGYPVEPFIRRSRVH